ncbi:MAG: 3-deoxy-7-phosphoheptulonate synthase, partial [Clostridiaceae bacterium]
GMGERGLEILKAAREETGLPIVTEIMSPSLVEKFVEDVDVIQIGARNMQNFDLLKEVGKTKTPILLKRGLSATVEEFLMSAEYIMSEGNDNVILCERGIRTFETYTRNTLDLSIVPVIKKLSHLPVIIDPSHAGGMWWLVEPLAKAAVAVGADGLMIEVHNDPANAKSDGAQSLKPEKFDALMNSLRGIAEAVDKEI